MAGVIRDILEAQAPGVFFGEQAHGLSYAPLIKSGKLEKLGRGRGVIGGLMGKKWAERNFNVHEDFRMQYKDKDVLRGEFQLENSTIEPVEKEDERAGGKEFVFEVTTKDGEKVYFAASSEDERSEWVACLRDVSSGKFKLNRYLDLIRQALQFPEGTKLNVELNREDFLKVMTADGYGAERMMEIIEQYLVNLHSHLVRYIAEDAVFRDLFLARFDTKTIRLEKAADNDTSNGYYRTYFRNGELQIHYVQAWTNVSQCGEDLVRSISEGETVPYLVYKSIRRYEPTLHSYMNGIERLFNITGVTYDYKVELNHPAMIAGGYTADRFGEIFIQEHLKTVIEKLSRLIAADPMNFMSAFTRKFQSKKIIIQPHPNPSNMNGYYQSSFTAQGDLLIQYKSVWTNINSLGDDIPSIV
mmetsp:Transcript_27717/g.30272  ORF Transcript_27717/g.30272 Transcript_27717/m.30272 type:complete len:414 (-) Transcript_27717:1412-2653(-)|eukprot:CAMPEP_0173151762 /NCGR_PEP_ID=MMETSP1105-20130129/11795_1 /TAXON_ID=2985 /ORGANISM="Ochromonas sp., Strain BG-1" /LENGTH=413 /DNA_ID=CAMNT_0014067243 /DNA_START=78 /DNA_END=1319 /DNA_ORIENTATION=+